MKNKLLIVYMEILGTVILGGGVLKAEDPKVTELNELVVEGKNAWVEKDKVVFIPTKTEKNLSSSAGDLIDRMGIPLLKGTGNSISTADGMPVHIFINGREATPHELMIFWPSLAKSVEYMSDPIDPQYKGYQRVVNFVMAEYAVGGISKFWGSQSYPWSGWYGAVTKLGYKKMTYMLSVSGHTTGSSEEKTEAREEFRNVMYEGQIYNEIQKSSKSEIPETKYGSISTKFSANYATSTFYVNNDIQFSFNRTYKDCQITKVAFVPAIYREINSNSNAWDKLANILVTGSLSKNFNRTKDLTLRWSYDYSHKNGGSIYELGDLPTIPNGTKENVHAVSVSGNYSMNIRNKFMLSFEIPFTFNAYSTEYVGSAHTISDIHRFNYGVVANADWQVNQKLRISLRPSARLSTIDIDRSWRTECVPAAGFSLTFAPDMKNYTSFYIDYTVVPVETSFLNNVMVRTSEFFWLAGNENLKSSGNFAGSLYHMFILSPKITLTGNLICSGEANPLVFDISHPAPGIDGLVKTFHNGKAYLRSSLVGGITYRPIKDLRLDGELAVGYEHGVKREFDFYRVGGNIRASYTIKNFSFDGGFQTPFKYLVNGGTGTLRGPCQYNLGVTYGNGNWYVRLNTNNLFIKRRWVTEQLVVADYSSMVRTGKVGNGVTLRVEYTFGYGKRINPRVEDLLERTGESSVLKHP